MRKDARPERLYSRYNPNYERNKRLVNRYGININEYNEMLSSQEGKCLLCERHRSEFKKALAVDHDHNTGKVRGLLCDHCNKGIGCLQDNVTILQKAISYLQKHQSILEAIQ